MTDLTSLDLETTAEELSTLSKLLRRAAPAPWEIDTEKNDGCYGSGEDTHEGFQSPVMFTADGKRLFDALNSDTASVEEEWDEDSHSAWDEVGRRNFELIAALRNASDRILRDFDKLAAEVTRLRALIAPGHINRDGTGVWPPQPAPAAEGGETLKGRLVKVPGLAYGDVPFRVLGVDGQKAWLKDENKGWSYVENIACCVLYDPAPTQPTQDDDSPVPAPDDLLYLRERGWAVAIHNDYWLAGDRYTFWLFTHRNLGRWVKGEGRTDAEAVAKARKDADTLHEIDSRSAPTPDMGKVEEALKALKTVNKIVSEAALTGFRYDTGDWAERLFASQWGTSQAIAALSQLLRSRTDG